MNTIRFLIREGYGDYTATLQGSPMQDGEYTHQARGRTPQDAIGNLVAELARAGLVQCSIKRYGQNTFPALWEPWPPDAPTTAVRIGDDAAWEEPQAG